MQIHTIIIEGIQQGSTQPVFLAVNGKETPLPVNKEVTVNDDQLAALADTDHKFTIVSSTAADEADQNPAPADSGDGGDAGGGGESGEDPAADTSGEAGEGEEAELPPHFLDRSVTAIIADLSTLSAEQLAKAKADEEAGKTRRSLIAAIDEALSKTTPAA
jgi:hypothetical protein